MVDAEIDDVPVSGAVLGHNLATNNRSESETRKEKETYHHETEGKTQANRRLVLLNEMANNLLLGNNPQEQINAAFDVVANELCAIFSFNYSTEVGSPGILVLVSSRGLNDEQEAAMRQLSFSEGLCGQVARSRCNLIIEHVDLRGDEETATIRAMGIKAYAGMPLIAHGHLFGAIAVGSTSLSAFSDSDIALLKTMADQSAAVLDRCRLSQTVRENEANLTDFFDNATIGLHWVGPDGIILRANNAELDLLGYSREEYVGHHIAEFHARREIIDDILTRLLRDEKLRDYEAQLLCKDGSVKDVQINSNGLWKDGKFVHSRCFTRDISERRSAENKLRVSEIRYRRLFEAAQDGVLLLDPGTFKITDANPFMSALLDYSHDQLVGKQLFEIGLMKDENASREVFQKLKSERHVRYENLPLKNQNGQHQEVEVVANLYDENGRDVIQCNIRDITERKRAEAHANLLMNEVNHRSKNLLSVVEAVARQTAPGGDPATFVARLSDRIHALATVQDLLVGNDWNGIEISALAEGQLAHFKDLIGTRVAINGPTLTLTPAAAQGIGMALHELATNALKYGALSNSCGRVNISWRVDDAEQPTFSMTWLEEGGPVVGAPSHSGFGQMVIGRMTQSALGGSVKIDYPQSGLQWTLDAPARTILEPAEIRRARAY